MAKKDVLAKIDRDDLDVAEKESSPTLERREFLQASLVGIAASAVGGSTTLATPLPDDTSSAPTASTPACQDSPCEAKDMSVPGQAPISFEGAFENWNEPWVWRPDQWPGQQLDLNVVENQSPGIEVGLGNASSVLFSYGGNTPGPTIRMRGDQTLSVRLRNLLGEDCGVTYIGPFPDLATLPPGFEAETAQEASRALGNERFDFCIGEHVNGVHSIHVTNLHTHGLHVRPDQNPDGTHSDNVILRVIPQGDFQRRERAVFRERLFDQEACQPCKEGCDDDCEKGYEGGCRTKYERAACNDINLRTGENPNNSACAFLRDPETIYFHTEDEVVAQADYEFRLGNNRVKECEPGEDGIPFEPPEPHPPGTHWYHPHAHGATAMQVSSGMAGFLIIEGDVDDTIGCFMTGSESPDPALKTGPWDYRERLMFMQRVFPGNRSNDQDSPKSQLNQTPRLLVNGSTPKNLEMRPGAIERWRVINGSVDGRGYKRFMVLEGNFQIIQVPNSCPGNTAPEFSLRRFDDKGQAHEVGLEDIERAKQPLWQLSTDGVTLVDPDTGKYTMKNLSLQNPDAVVPGKDPLTACPPPEIAEQIEKMSSPRDRKIACKLWRLNNAFKNAENVCNAFVRPNEYYMGPANRTDVFFQMPPNAKKGQIYTVFARGVSIHSDTPVMKLQQNLGGTCLPLPETDIIVGYVLVGDGEVEGSKDFHQVMEDLEKCLPQAPAYLQPVRDCELETQDGKVRTRTITYSGWGGEGYPLVTTSPDNPSSEACREFVENDQKKAKKTGKPSLENLRYTTFTDANGEEATVLLPPSVRTMAINGKKFKFDDPDRPKMQIDTAEEWVLYNTTQTMWADTDSEKQPVGQFKGHYVALPITRGQGRELFWDPCEAGKYDFRVVTRGIDHPFHIHQNPFWMVRLEIPDENGNLVNLMEQRDSRGNRILDPRWMDTIWIPRNIGRVVFRSRFPDYLGIYVNHCHILLHEDNGMMQSVQATPFEDQANFVPKDKDHIFQSDTPVKDVDRLSERPSLSDAYRINSRFVDQNHAGHQVFPGFDLTVPDCENLPKGLCKGEYGPCADPRCRVCGRS